MRHFTMALLASAILLTTSFGAEVKGTLKSADKEKATLTLTVDMKETDYKVSKDASFVNVKTVKGKKNKTMDEVTNIEGGLGSLKNGSTVTIFTEKKEDVEVITSVKVTGDTGTPAKDKKKKKKPAK
jgi:hypothetical protein